MKVYKVNKARKDNAVVKKGEPYYYWCPRHGGRRLSATYPKRSQLCQGRNAAFYAALENLEEAVASASDTDELESLRDECVSALEEVRDEYQEGYDNIPEALQYAPVGETMQEAIDSIEGLINDLECWNPDDFDEPYRDEQDDDEWEEELAAAHDEFISAQRDDLVQCSQEHCFPY